MSEGDDAGAKPPPPPGSGPWSRSSRQSRRVCRWRPVAMAACRGSRRLRVGRPVTEHLPSAPNGNSLLTLIGTELQRQEECLQLMQQLKAQLGKLTASLHAVLDGHAEQAAPSLKPATAAIYTTLLGLASLRPPQPDKTHDAVYEIGTAVKSLNLKHLDDPHATDDALSLAKTVADSLRSTAGSIGAGHLLSAEA